MFVEIVDKYPGLSQNITTFLSLLRQHHPSLSKMTDTFQHSLPPPPRPKRLLDQTNPSPTSPTSELAHGSRVQQSLDNMRGEHQQGYKQVFIRLDALDKSMSEVKTSLDRVRTSVSHQGYEHGTLKRNFENLEEEYDTFSAEVRIHEEANPTLVARHSAQIKELRWEDKNLLGLYREQRDQYVKMEGRLERHIDKVEKDLKEQINGVAKNVSNLDLSMNLKFTKVEEKIDNNHLNATNAMESMRRELGGRMDAMEGNMNERFTSVDAKFVAMDMRLTRMEKNFDALLNFFGIPLAPSPSPSLGFVHSTEPIIEPPANPASQSSSSRSSTPSSVAFASPTPPVESQAISRYGVGLYDANEGNPSGAPPPAEVPASGPPLDQQAYDAVTRDSTKALVSISTFLRTVRRSASKFSLKSTKSKKDRQ